MPIRYCRMQPASVIIVIGASVGGVAALQALVQALPADLAAAVFIVLHTGAHKSELPNLLTGKGPLPAIHPATGNQIYAGHIYVAPPDHHLLVEPGRVRLSKGPRENWARPAIDPLFRSAASAYGSMVIGVILTGALNDGTAGLFQVARHGGTTVVQDPREAENPSMPRSALAHVRVDHCVALQSLAPLLVRLVDEKLAPVSARRGTRPPTTGKKGREMTSDYTHDRPVAVTCPDCGGALRQSKLGTLSQFRCHIGHVYTGEVMMRAQFHALEQSLELALRALGERRELCRQMAELADAEALAATEWEAAENEAAEQGLALQKIVEREWIQPSGPNLVS